MSNVNNSFTISPEVLSDRLTTMLLQAAVKNGQITQEEAPQYEDTLDGLLSGLFHSEEDLPSLASPGSTGFTVGGLSLDSLMKALNEEIRKNEIKSGLDSIEAKGEERAEKHKEHIEEIQKQLDEQKNKSFWDILGDVFTYIGAAIGAVIGGVMIATGAGAAIGAAMIALSVSTILEKATDGKVGFSPEFIVGKIMEAAGASEEAIGWTKMAVGLATSIALTAASMGAISAQAAKAAEQVAKGVEVTAKLTKTASTILKAGQMANAATQLAGAGTSIASATYQYKIEQSRADMQELQAILERINQAQDLEETHLENMMEALQEIVETTSDIIQQGAQTQAEILTAAPTMA